MKIGQLYLYPGFPNRDPPDWAIWKCVGLNPNQYILVKNFCGNSGGQSLIIAEEDKVFIELTAEKLLEFKAKFL